MNLGDPVPELCSLDIFHYLAIPENAFQSDELPLLESLGELQEISPGIDAVPFCTVFVVALVVLPAFLGGDVEYDVPYATIMGFEVMRALRKGQAAIFNLTQDIRGEARIVERAFGIGASMLAEAVAVIGEQLEFKPA